MLLEGWEKLFENCFSGSVGVLACVALLAVHGGLDTGVGSALEIRLTHDDEQTNSRQGCRKPDVVRSCRVHRQVKVRLQRNETMHA